ncbi:MAG: ATPase, T2SS/T4P/T4SS family [Calditerrivibrio sp.]|nr:ATPase, T2SS/T4P/T4SS family [Calditerrivibrio sp.]
MKRLGEILIERKILTKEDLDQLLAKQQITKEKLGDLVVKMGYLTSDQLLSIIAEQYGLQYLNIKEIVIPQSVQKEFNFDVLKNYRIVPLKIEDKKAYVGINNVNILKDLDEISFNLGKTVIPVLLSETTVDRMLDDLEKLPYGTKDYHFKSLELMMQGGKDFDNLIMTIINFDNKIERIFFKENSSPFIKKYNYVEKIPYEKFTKNHILNIIKEVCDESDRKTLVANGFVSVKRLIDSKRFTVNFYKEKSSFFILVINHSSVITDISSFNLSKDIYKNLIEPVKGIIFLIAPFGHGKSTMLNAIIDYFNSTRNINMLYVVDRVYESIRNHKSNIIQIEKENIKGRKDFNDLLNDFDPNILFFDNLDSAETLNYIYKFVEAGRPAYVSVESNSIPSTLESILYTEREQAYKYHLNRLADNINLFVNFRLIPGKKSQNKYFIYEYCTNNFKLKKIIRDNSFNIINTQMRGTGEYQPFEVQMADLFLKNLISYDVAESYALDVELFKRLAKISG